jgi:hypothetical protein
MAVDGCQQTVSHGEHDIRTPRSGVLAKVLCLVTAQQAGWLDLGGWASGKLLVEVDDALHADSIRRSTNGLSIKFVSITPCESSDAAPAVSESRQ